MIRAQKLRMVDSSDPTKEHDVGQVGDIVSVDPSVVKALQDDAFIPVISPIGFGENNESYNINADVVAAKLATVLKAEVSVNDATKLSGITGPFDFALDLGCFHGISKEGQAKYLDQLDRILAPNGFWLLYAFLNPNTPPSSSGLAEADLNLISTHFTLLTRRDGFDKRERQSAWFLYQKKEKYIRKTKN